MARLASVWSDLVDQQTVAVVGDAEIAAATSEALLWMDHSALFLGNTGTRADRTGRRIVAIVGLGFGAEFIPIYQNYPGAEMYAICRRDQKGLDEVGDGGLLQRFEQRLETMTARIRAQFIREAVENVLDSGIKPLPSPLMVYDFTYNQWYEIEDHRLDEIPEYPPTAMLAAIENGIERRRA